jgi:Na+-transporting NADH:ubiquinone oxidoreductase subunit E
MEPQISPFVIFLAAVFTNNILLSNFLGMCSFIALSKRVDSSLGIGIAVIFVSTFTTAINWLVYNYILRKGALIWILGDSAMKINLEIFTLIIFLEVIAAFVQIVEMFIDRFSPPLYHTLGIFLPLITVNCAILGVSLFMIIRNYSFFQAVAYGFGGGVGWTMAIVAMAGLRKKLRYSNVPAPLEGIGITMIMTGLIAMAFMAFNGMVRLS